MSADTATDTHETIGARLGCTADQAATLASTFEAASTWLTIIAALDAIEHDGGAGAPGTVRRDILDSQWREANSNQENHMSDFYYWADYFEVDADAALEALGL